MLESQLTAVSVALNGAPVIVMPDGSLSVDAFDRFASDVVTRSSLGALALEAVIDHAARPAVEGELGRPITDRGPNGLVTAPFREQYCPVVRVSPLTDEASPCSTSAL